MPKEPEKHQAKKPAKKHSVIKHHKKVFDVVPPGKAPAAPNSRSVVPSNKPPVADDQFVPGAPRLRVDNPSEKRTLLEHRKKGVSIAVDSAPQASGSTPPIEATPPVAQADTAPAAPSVPELPTVPEVPKVQGEVTGPLPAPSEQEAEPVAADQRDVPLAPSDQSEEEAKAGQLAVEQVVETSDIGVSEPASSPAAPVAVHRNAKSIDELLAESGAPTLAPTEPAPGLIISHHKPKSSWAPPVLIFLAVLIVAGLILNFLLDAEIIRTQLELPHTDLL